MGRKLVRRVPVEPDRSRRVAKGHIAIILAQHLLLYSSGYVVASTAYLIYNETITNDLLPAAVIMIFAGCKSLVYICLCNATAWRTLQPAGKSFLRSSACLETLSKNAIRFAATAWMIASGLAITFTVAGRPTCLMSARARLHSPAVDVDVDCMIQRASVAGSLLSMTASIALWISTPKKTDSYLAHMFGIIKPPQLLPFVLPYKTGDRPMFSDMSFKCRSASSFSSYTLVEEKEDPLYTLYPTRPEKAYGLGIYAPKTSAASFLTPRPSLRTIRSQASFGHRPLRTPPVPPLPVYHPEKYKDMAAARKLLHPPQRVYTLRRKNTQRKLRAMQCASMPSDDKSHTIDRAVSKESLQRLQQERQWKQPEPSPWDCRRGGTEGR